MITNNVTRFLTARKIPFEVFELPEEKIGALEAAQLLNIPAYLMFKTIVITRDKGKPILAVIPGDTVVDLKAVALFIGEKKVHLPTQREAEKLTGLLAGGISPLALLDKGFTVLVDEAAKQHEYIHISGGQRGVNIRLPVNAFIKLTNARLAKISNPQTM
ncbi:MAG: YbaK/EbsC family protein [Anaerolineales bacterium]